MPLDTPADLAVSTRGLTRITAISGNMRILQFGVKYGF